jgi:hypothetical protein
MEHLNKKYDHSIAHSYVYGRVRGKTKGNLVDRKRILEILRYIIRIPGPHQLDFLAEMIDSGFFKKISRDRYEILRKAKIKTPRDFYGSPLW